MPVKETEKIIIEFKYDDRDYVLETWRIYDSDGGYICNCDFTGTKYYGDRDLMEFAAKMCLRSYFIGKFVGEQEGRSEIQDELKRVLGIS